MESKIKLAYEEWLNSSLLTKEEKEELLAIKDNEKEIEDRFYRDLEFGTGGLRGVMALGTNRMNTYVIRRATQGFANYLLSKFDNPSVAIAYDSRNNSHTFAKETANVLASSGIKVFIYPELMPTPSLSFAVRYLKCQAGVVVTASHNPKQYNGYKVYGPDGCQCTPEFASAILNEIGKVDIFKDVKLGDFDKLVSQKSINFIGQEVFDAYISSTLKQSVYSEDKKLNIVYTPLHGSGRKPVLAALDKDGFKNINVVKEQELPDGNFPTASYPNPETKEALKLGIDLMIKTGSDILLATDPDSDRVGVAVNQNGEPVILTGNEVGIVLFDALYHAKKEQGKLPKNPVLVKSIVSTNLVDLMGKKYGVEVRNVLTGFKFIGEQMTLLDNKGEIDRFLLGFEESCGYLTNPDVYDKDAVNACLLMGEVANHYKLQGKTVVDRLKEIYAEFGYSTTTIVTFEFPGIEGAQKMSSLMTLFRSEEVKKMIPNIVSIADYQSGIINENGQTRPTGLPKSNVMKFDLKDNEAIIVRPSGTEPKLKLYFFAKSKESLAGLVSLAKKIVG